MRRRKAYPPRSLLYTAVCGLSYLYKKRRLFLCLIILISCSFAYIIYVPYDFTMVALTEIYDRCRIENAFSYSGYVSLQTNNSTNCPDESSFVVKWRNSTFTSRSPWISIVGRKLIAYSAYYLEKSKIVRLLVLKHTRDCRPVWCYFENGRTNYSATPNQLSSTSYSGDPQRLSPGSYNLIRLDCWWECDYFESFYVDCPITPESGSINAVSLIPVDFIPCALSNKEFRNLWPTIPVARIPSLAGKFYKYELSVCIAPMFNWTDTLKFVLFIQYYLRNGATRFVIYHRSWSSDMDRIIAHYSKQPRVSFELIEWPLLPPVDGVGEEINVLNRHVSYNGQVLAMNDCGLREHGRSHFVAHVDVDEFIFTFESKHSSGTFGSKDSGGHDHRRSTVLTLLQELDGPQIGSFLFDHVRVYSNLAASDQRSMMISNITALIKGSVDQFPGRVKSVVKPEAISKQGIHFVWQHERNYKKVIVPGERAVFYHVSDLEKARDRSHKDVQEELELGPFRSALKELEEEVNTVLAAALK